jgi:hypothetical protein
MKFLTALLLTALLAFATNLYLPWWALAITSAVVAYAIIQQPLKAFLSGFLGVFILWACLCYFKSSGNQHILAQKIAQLILKNNSAYLLMAVTAFLGALVSGLAALAGSFLRATK